MMIRFDVQGEIDRALDELHKRHPEDGRSFDEWHERLSEMNRRMTEPPPPYVTVAECGHCFADIGERE